MANAYESALAQANSEKSDRGTRSIKQIVDEFERIANVSHSEVAAELNEVYVYDRWTAEEIVYFFSKYEEQLSADRGEEIDQPTWARIWESASKDKSVEHIFPQKDPFGNWRGKGRQKVNPETFVHRLGNLLVLPPGLNSKAGTKSFADKVQIYKTVRGLHYVGNVTRLRDWNLTAIEKRERDLMRFAKQRWWGHS